VAKTSRIIKIPALQGKIIKLGQNTLHCDRVQFIYGCFCREGGNIPQI